MAIRDKYLRVDFEGESFAVPLWVIANSRASHYADEYGGNVAKSLDEDTIPLFEADGYEAIDWASNNMDWADMKGHAVPIRPRHEPPDREKQWSNADKSVVGPEVLG